MEVLSVFRKVDLWFIVVLLLSISACGSSPSTTIQPGSTVKLPDEITQLRLQDNGSVHAYVQVDGGDKTEMAITGTSAELQLALSEGSHNVAIIFEYVPSSAPTTTVILADSSKSVNVVASSHVALAFDTSEFDFNAYDDDHDGISNLSEMQSGTSAPVVTGTSPLDGSNNVAASATIDVMFDDPMILTTLQTGFTISSPKTGVVAGTVTYDDATRTAHFTPEHPLHPYETYTASLSTSATNSADIALNVPLSWSFSIEEPQVQQVSNTFSPLGTGTPILKFNDLGQGMAVWSDIHVGQALVYSYFDGSSWSAPGVLSSIPDDYYDLHPQLASNGTGFALVWRERYGLQTIPYDTKRQIKGSFFEAGSWTTPMRVDTGFGYPTIRPQLASNGTGYAVTWAESNDNDYKERVFARISTGTNWGDAVPIDNASSDAWNPRIASNGSGYAVIWEQDSDEVAVNVYAGLWSSDTAQILATATNKLMSYQVVSNGAGYSVVWEEYAASKYSIYSASYYNDGNGFIWGATKQISDPSGSFEMTYSDGEGVVSNEVGYAVVLVESSGKGVFAPFDSSGDGSWQAPIALNDDATADARATIIASNARTYIALWVSNDASSNYDVYASVFNGASWDPPVVIDSENGQVQSDSIRFQSQGEHFVAIWQQVVEGVSHTYANIFTGGSWEASAFQLDSATFSTGYPAVAQNTLDGEVVAIWNETGSGLISKSYTGASWSLPDAVSTTVPGGDSQSPRLIDNGNGKVLALWLQTFGNYNGYLGSEDNYELKLYANIFENGAWGIPRILSTGQVVWYKGLSDYGFSAATNGDGFAVAWTQYDELIQSVYAAVYDAAGWESAQQIDNPEFKNSYLDRFVFESGEETIASTETGYTVFFSQYDGVNVSRNSYTTTYNGSSWGLPQSLAPAIVSPESSSLSFNNNTEYLSVTVSSISGQAQLYAKFYQSGSWGDELALDNGTPGHQVLTGYQALTGRDYSAPFAVHSSGRLFAVTWIENNGVNDEIMVTTYDGTNWAEPTSLDDGLLGVVSFDTINTVGELASFGDLLTTNGTGYAVVWQRENVDTDEIYASVFDGSSWSAAVPVVTGVTDVINFQIASNGDGFLAAWEQDDGNGIYNIMSSRYTQGSGWERPRLMEENDNSSALDLKLSGSSEGYSMIWTQAEPSGDPGTLYPWAKIKF